MMKSEKTLLLEKKKYNFDDLVDVEEEIKSPILYKEMTKGNGDKKIVVADDNEGNVTDPRNSKSNLNGLKIKSKRRPIRSQPQNTVDI